MGPDLHSNPIKCSLLPVQVSQGRKEQEKIARDSGKLLFQHQDQIKIKKKIKKRTKENRKKYLRQVELLYQHQLIDNYNGTQSQQATTHSQRFLKSIPEKYYQPCIWCISYSHQLERQGIRQIKERQIPSFSGPVWECDSKTRRLEVQKLLRNECLDLFMPVETRSPNHILQSYSELVDRLKNDRKFREFHEPTDKELIDQENSLKNKWFHSCL
ncbi:unnamed protein product [Rhizophagus irregularis]|uniref:Uncharacterized protein n=1 Tax=Rhizophagus irregularis TaxID=588596 RepID=A0A2N1M9T0_9GLOM|nr:hypothetical protein RhiirC2_796411 [Rhizophagus irregularis]CAB4391490.1 unnamed protein product [Rhizophagus irregularis]CAB5364344.1 unnamed protein product [Rhizophagus irregularis]